MRFQKVDDAARVGDLQNKIGQGVGLILMPVGAVEDFAARKVNIDIIALGDVCSSGGTFENGQADVDAVAEKDARKGRGDDALGLRTFDGDGRVLA